MRVVALKYLIAWVSYDGAIIFDLNMNIIKRPAFDSFQLKRFPGSRDEETTKS